MSKRESDLSLEVVILLILGVFMSLFGLLVFRINSGDLPYNPDSVYGLFLVIISIQIITMGKTPFGELRRSWAVIMVGTIMSILGIVSCFVPGIFTLLVRILVGVMLFLGGISLLVQLYISEDKAKLWMKTSGVLRHLTIACTIIYVMMIVLGFFTLLPVIFNLSLSTPPSSIGGVLLIIFGLGFFYLSWCLQKTTRLYLPEEIRNPALSHTLKTSSLSQKGFKLFQEASIPLSQSILMLMAILITLISLLLFPTFLGLIVFSSDGQLGLLMVIMAINLMALGETPIGSYTRSWLLVIIGMVFATLGIFISIVPGILTDLIRILLGTLNILGGSVLLIKTLLPIVQDMMNPPAEPVPVPPLLSRLVITIIVMNIVGIAFGLSMLLPGFIPVLILPLILFIFGLIMFYMIYLSGKISQMERMEPGKDVS